MATKKCPKCGSKYVYVGAIDIECGENPTCENWTNKQAMEVRKLLKEVTLVEADDYGLPLPDFDDEETNPGFRSPYFHSD